MLVRRQWTILNADWKNFLILFGQPLVIALLVSYVTDDTTLGLFFAYLATLWFGCSNAAQEIVREIAIYRRERMVGLGRHQYLLSKFTLLGTLTAVQGVFLYLCMWGARWYLYNELDFGVERGISGSPLWQIGSVVCTAYASVGIGFAISALARSEMQAVMIVPLVLIPQILFSGLVVETKDMASKVVFRLTSIMPSYAAQTMMDVGAFWNRPIIGGMYNNRQKAGDHLKDLRLRELVANPPNPEMTKGDLRMQAAKELGVRKIYNRADVGDDGRAQAAGVDGVGLRDGVVRPAGEGTGVEFSYETVVLLVVGLPHLENPDPQRVEIRVRQSGRVPFRLKRFAFASGGASSF